MRRFNKKIYLTVFFIFICTFFFNRSEDRHRYEYIITMPSEEAAIFAAKNGFKPLSFTERTGRFILASSYYELSQNEENLLKADLNAVSIEEDLPVAVFETDRYFGREWAVNGASGGINLSYVKDYISKETSQREVVVAVIDTGVDINHEDLSENIWVNPGEIPDDGKDNDGNGFIDDVNGWDFYNGDATVCHYETNPGTGEKKCDPKDSDNHGTHVAGIIAAIPDNGIGVYGAASPFVNVKIMVLKCLGGGSNLTPGKGSMYDTIKAIEYATSMGADICNLSWGNTVYSSGLYEAIKDSDMLFVTAAGNTSDNNDDIPMYPASYELPNVISVASTGQKGEISEFSNYGPHSVDIAAPGERIISTVVGSYDTMSGTSMSAPFVSGVAAILYAASDYTYAASIKETLIATARKTPALSDYLKTPGIVDASFAASMSEFLADDFEAPSLKTDVKIDKDIRLTVKYEDIGSSGLRVAKYLYGHKSLYAFHRGMVGLPLKEGENILSKKGTYTVYLSDYAGNDEIFEIDAREYPVTELSTTYSRKMLRKGRTYKIKYHIAPKVNTETISFSSSSKKIATVSKDGVITAKKKGSCTITVKTSGGMKAKFKLYVK